MEKYLEMLGHRFRDRVTGIAGVAESVSVDLYGCVQAMIRADAIKDKDEQYPKGFWLDVTRLEQLSVEPVMPRVTTRIESNPPGPADKPTGRPA